MGKWTVYKAISFEDKKVFFTKRPEFKDTLFSFSDDAISTLILTKSAPIVNFLIGELFFNSKDETIFAETAMKLFRRQEDGTYNVTIKTPLRYQLAVQHTSAGLSFRQTATVIQQHQNLTKNTKLTGVTDALVSGYVRILVAVVIQHPSDLMSNPSMWAFSFACDTRTHMGISCMGNQRLRLVVDGLLVEL